MHISESRCPVFLSKDEEKKPCLLYPDGLDLRSPSPCSQMPGEGSMGGSFIPVVKGFRGGKN